ncbi:heme ABC exporter ATP-binding protein CcmA [Niveispirillum cyanobacteriorum]|uniref:heme ABC exporter ATP-binding protein CcmA n=1 Tax=Niveispirillum cyanobacteriorum TaxID=1612173 RepID=UPI0019C9A832|nr:heme ABC exporter ATP-binding protein CcmA [Niveispirillum cyanobacteriorum]GGE54490.1 cytochrome c biogenesis ATP-binding export protein CcmA [Niveispirillum cyanobacteriorum]
MTQGQTQSADPGLAARHLTCLRGERVVFADLDFTLSPGGALILVGPNGSGKSSLLRLLAGLSRPFSGALTWNGTDIAQDPDAHRARLRYAGHQDAVKPTLTALENLSVWAGLDGLDDPEDRAGRALAALAMDHVADMPGRYLSAGQKKRVNLARLALAPARTAPLWLLDEPATALDRDSIDRLAALIAAHRRAGGMVVLSTHSDMDVADASMLNLADFGATTDDEDESQNEAVGVPA